MAYIKTITFTVEDDHLVTDDTVLGRVGENLATLLRVDVSYWQEQWPSAVYQILIRRSDSTILTLATNLTPTGGMISAGITSECAMATGSVRVEVRVYTDGALAISGQGDLLTVESSLMQDANRTPSWYADATAALNTLLDAARAQANVEIDRVAAEASRVLTEIARAAAETARASAEQLRAGAESVRKTQEAARVTQDAARTAAETARATQHATKMAAVDAATVTAQQAANAAYLHDPTQSVAFTFDGDGYLYLVPVASRT
ncbi:MAG: hypothetical protein RR301_08720 [Clostridia bacterium]